MVQASGSLLQSTWHCTTLAPGQRTWALPHRLCWWDASPWLLESCKHRWCCNGRRNRVGRSLVRESYSPFCFLLKEFQDSHIQPQPRRQTPLSTVFTWLLPTWLATVEPVREMNQEKQYSQRMKKVTHVAKDSHGKRRDNIFTIY